MRNGNIIARSGSAGHALMAGIMGGAQDPHAMNRPLMLHWLSVPSILEYPQEEPRGSYTCPMQAISESHQTLTGNLVKGTMAVIPSGVMIIRVRAEFPEGCYPREEASWCYLGYGDELAFYRVQKVTQYVGSVVLELFEQAGL